MGTLPILVFWEIIKQNNLKLLDVNFKENKEYHDFDLKLINDTWNDLYDDLFVLKNNSEAKYYLKSNVDRLLLVHINNLLNDIRERYILLYNIKDEEFLTEWITEKKIILYNEIKEIQPKARINQFDDILVLIENVEGLIKSNQNLYNEKSNVIEKKIDNKIQNIYSTIAKLGSALGYQLNVKEMSVLEYLAYEKQAEELSKARNNGK